MKSSAYFLVTSPWIIAFLLPIFTFAYGSFSKFTLFLFFFFIIILSSSLFLPLPKQKKEDEHVQDETKIGFLSKGSSESSSTSEEDTDGSITDEDGLIEIELPARNYAGLIEMWSEEDNLIEIDISMGSIK
ncbi:hypothetical protein L1987_31766 [Smallanthus sonchifolius]|uniref:Uncharacterized protein n=1 Tax=Smallanthus sonchifolius TaxID=185202 RepID=A0ACB9I6H5_9ASTR|nr:hypothetical protein L1987_31766 [Smallanthus sonchifolius]